MIRYWLDLLTDAVVSSFQRLGTTVAGIGSACLILAVNIYLFRRDGLQARSLVGGAIVAFLCWLPFCVFELAQLTYQRFNASNAAMVNAAQHADQLSSALEVKRHYMDVSEPAYANAWNVTMAFWRWRQAIGSDSAVLLVTADKPGNRLASAFIQFAVTGSGLGNGKLQNIGIKPEDTDDIERSASVDGTLVIHALADVKGVMQLVDALSPLVVRVERSYKMPPTPSPLPPNVLWLHFSHGVRWSSEYWDEQAAQKAKKSTSIP